MDIPAEILQAAAAVSGTGPGGCGGAGAGDASTFGMEAFNMMTQQLVEGTTAMGQGADAAAGPNGLAPICGGGAAAMGMGMMGCGADAGAAGMMMLMGGDASGAGDEDQGNGFSGGVDAFISMHQLNKEGCDVLMSLTPDIQEIVMRQFRPKTATPGTYEMNGKFIMFARSVERGQKGKGKDKGKGKGKGMMGKDSWGWDMGGKGWGGDGWGPAWGKGDDWGWGGDEWGWGGDWGWGGKGDQWGMGGGCWGKGKGGGGGKGWGQDWGKGGGGKGWGGKDSKGGGKCKGGGVDPNAKGPTPIELQVFVERWALNEDAINVLNSLPPPTQTSVMEQFKGGEVGQVNGRFIVFARGVQKGRFGTGGGGGGKGGGWGKDGGMRFSPY